MLIESSSFSLVFCLMFYDVIEANLPIVDCNVGTSRGCRVYTVEQKKSSFKGQIQSSCSSIDDIL